MKNIVILILCISSHCLAQLPESFLCRKEAINFINGKSTVKNLNWVKQRNDHNSFQVFRAQIHFNEWIELKTDLKFAPAISFFNEKKYTDYKLNSNCELLTSTSGVLDIFQNELVDTSKDFTSKDLQKLVGSGKSGIIYLYSPKMTYSMTEFSRIKKGLMKSGYALTALMDPYVDPQVTATFAKSLDLQFKGRRMASLDLYMMNGLDHYPTLFFYSNNKLYPHKLSGIHDEKNIKNLLAQWKAELK
ncbi:MAG: hypothetical protein H7328_05385 [Bdellovibrio sp.]|nr:hypothetical protein [Bdellovibrio sp.]